MKRCRLYSLCREIDNVFGALRTCFDHVLSKFSGFSWERILFLKSASVNMVMKLQVQIGDTSIVFFYESARECWGFKKLHFAWDSEDTFYGFWLTLRKRWRRICSVEWRSHGRHSPRIACFTCLVYISTYCVPIALLRRTWGKFSSLPAKKPRKFEGGRRVALVVTSGSQLSLFWHIEN